MIELKRVKLKELIKEVNERNKGEKIKRVLSVTNSRGFVNQEEYFDGTVHSTDISNYKIVRKNQFAYNPSRVNVGSIDILKNFEEGALSPMYVVFEVDTTRLLPEYFKYYFQTNRFFENVKNSTQGSVRNSLNFKALSNFEILLPSIEEQEKIVTILNNIDKIINKENLAIELLKNEKRGYFEKLLKANLCLKKQKFSKYITEYNEKTSDKIKFPLYSLTIEKGIIPKSEKYEREFLVKKTEDMYKIVPPNAFVYNPMNARFGAIKANHEKFAVAVSGYYDVFYMGTEKTLQFWENYLTSQIMLKVYNSISNGSLIEKQRVHFSQFTNIEMRIPEIDEQKKISNILDKFEKAINKRIEEMECYKNLKKGLMQKLLTGKVKVNV